MLSFKCFYMFAYEDEFFTIRMHHGGKWFEDCYKDGYVALFDYVDKDALSLFERDGMVETLGYDGCTLYYYKELDKDYFNGLQLLQTDEEVVQMGKYVLGTREIDMYLEHISPKDSAQKMKMLYRLY